VLVAQYTTQLLIPDVERRIDDVQYANYNIPTLMYGCRVLKSENRTSVWGVDYIFTEDDYVDGREQKSYATPAVEFNTDLSATQAATLRAVNAMLLCLVRDKPVSDKNLKSALTELQCDSYEYALNTEQNPSEINYGGGLPLELISYKRFLQMADFQHNKYERMCTQKNRGKARYKSETIFRESNKTDGLYEDAIEDLEQIWSSASQLQQHNIQLWMDRTIDFDEGLKRKIGIEPESIPRVRGSKSVHALDSGLPKLSKRLKRKECQLIALRDAAWQLAFLQKPNAESMLTQGEDLQQRDKLKSMLQRLKSI
jgi:hypothetical protein